MEVSKEQMQALQTLADTNLKISEAKNTLLRLQEEETDYLVSREKKAVEKIEQVVKDSQSLVNEIKDNHEKVQEFYQTVSSFTGFMTETYDKFHHISEDFEKRTEAWEIKVKTQMSDVSLIRKEVQKDREKLDKELEALKDKEKGLKALAGHLESRQTTLEASYAVEKELWNKLNKN